MKRLWDKGEALDAQILRYTAGEDHILDDRLVAYDVRASIAHANMLNQQQLLSDVDCEMIRDGLEQLAETYQAGEWNISLDDEDAHTALESRLVNNIGEAGKRIHLGRSRNDQVLAALRVAQHPDKTFVGKISRGFDFLGYRFASAGLIGVARQSAE